MEQLIFRTMRISLKSAEVNALKARLIWSSED